MTTNPIPKGEEIKGNVTKYLDGRFLNALMIIDKVPLTVTIDRVEYLDLLEYDNGQKDKNVLLIYFKENLKKPFVLKATNIKLIGLSLKTTEYEKWKGQKIILGVENINTRQGVKPGIRVQGKGV